ncbi:hypothetical protein ABZ864_41565 [Streptomyces sp. NPDC047082]
MTDPLRGDAAGLALSEVQELAVAPLLAGGERPGLRAARRRQFG